MAAGLKTELNIPDLWYDFYARLLPGSAFIAGIRTMYFGNFAIPTLEEALVLLGASYLVGLASQPLSSRIIGLVQTLGERIAGITDKRFIKKVQHTLQSDSRAALILSKMHGEVAFFVQIGTLSIVWSILLCTASKFSGYYLFIPGASFLFALEVANRRAKRAKDLESIIKESGANQKPAQSDHAAAEAKNS